MQFLRNPGKYKSVSAFAPITNPINCPWGQKAFKGYFGEDQQEKWKEHDATELIKKWNGPELDILIDVVSNSPSHLFFLKHLDPPPPPRRCLGKKRLQFP